MNIGLYTCLSMGIIFLFMGLLFLLLKEKAAMLISGFNTLPKETRKDYDQKKISKDQRNTFFLWAFVMAAGCIASYYISTYAAVPTFIIWLILFFKEVHLDTEKAFGKYKLKK